MIQTREMIHYQVQISFTENDLSLKTDPFLTLIQFSLDTVVHFHDLGHAFKSFC